MLSAFAMAHKVLILGEKTNNDNDNDENDDIYLKQAKEIANFLYKNMRDTSNGYLYRIYGKRDIYGFSVDYSFLIHGLLDLYECSFESKWLKWAIELQEIQNKLFFDNDIGGYYETIENSQNIIMRLKEEYDGAEPCSSTFAVRNLGLFTRHILFYR